MIPRFSIRAYVSRPFVPSITQWMDWELYTGFDCDRHDNTVFFDSRNGEIWGKVERSPVNPWTAWSPTTIEQPDAGYGLPLSFLPRPVWAAFEQLALELPSTLLLREFDLPTGLPMTPEVMARIQELRMDVMNGTVTLDQIKESVRLLREHRMSAAYAASKPKAAAKTTKTPIDGQKLIDDFF